VPIGTRLRAVLEMRRLDPEGEAPGPEAYVFGNAVGEQIIETNEAWLATCQRAAIRSLRFHDLRREFASRLLETQAELHDVRDFLGHANITTTSRYLRSSSVRLATALERLEAVHGEVCTPFAQTDETPEDAPSDESAELVDPGGNVVVSPEGIEPSTNRLRVCCSAN
jgi:Phage integrase family